MIPPTNLTNIGPTNKEYSSTKKSIREIILGLFLGFYSIAV